MAPNGIDLDAVIAKQGDHSIFAPSASAMWLTCPGSLIPNVLADDHAGFEAAQGTVAHGVAETWLRSGERPDYLVGTSEIVEEGDQSFEIFIDLEMLNYVEQYVDWCLYVEGDQHVEVRVDFSQLTPIPKQKGTADHIACQKGLLTITDLKYGTGVQVFAEGNTQAQIYALGAFFEWDHKYHFERIVIRIAQPRLDHFDVWEISREDLLEFAEYVRERAALAWQTNAPRHPSEKGCQWCKVRSSCGALAALTHELVEGIFDNLDQDIPHSEIEYLKERLMDAERPFGISPQDPHTLDTEHLAKLYPYRKLIENFLKSVEDELERRAEQGEYIPGYKLVEGRTNRKFNAEEAKMVDTLELMFGLDRVDLYEEVFTTPSKLEGTLKKKGYKAAQLAALMPALVYKPAGKPVLAPLSDKRPALSKLVEDTFDNLDEDDDL